MFIHPRAYCLWTRVCVISFFSECSLSIDDNVICVELFILFRFFLRVDDIPVLVMRQIGWTPQMKTENMRETEIILSKNSFLFEEKI